MYPQIEQARDDKHAERDPAHRPEAQAGVSDEACTQRLILQSASDRHQDQRDEEHPADPGDGREHMNPPNEERHGGQDSTPPRPTGPPL
jgi:hypothetical protein